MGSIRLIVIKEIFSNLPTTTMYITYQYINYLGIFGYFVMIEQLDTAIRWQIISTPT